VALIPAQEDRGKLLGMSTSQFATISNRGMLVVTPI